LSISTVFIKRPIGTALLGIAIFLIGSAAWPLLPVAPLPQVDFPTLLVTGSLPGAAPETMAASVAQPLERQFSQIPGLAQMTSSSFLGQTQVTLQFDLDRNIDGAALDVQSALNAAAGQLPSNLPSPPSIKKINPADSPILVLAVQSDTLPLTVVSDYSDNVLAQQISRIPGVGLVNVNGAQHASANQVNLQVTYSQQRLVKRTASARDGLNSGQQLIEGERLDKIVVCPALQSLDSVGGAIARGQHQDRRALDFPQRPQHRKAIPTRQHGIQNNGVIVLVGCKMKAIDSIHRQVYAVALLSESLA